MIDQASKHVLEARLGPGAVVAVLPSLNFVIAHNHGVSFSLLELPSAAQRWPLALLALLVSGGLVRWLGKLPADRARLAIAIALVLGGALGNLVDRARLGYVIDFVQVYYGAWSFAVFNLADAAISLGVALMLLDWGLRKDRV